jgi:hypothetical protein
MLGCLGVLLLHVTATDSASAAGSPICSNPIPLPLFRKNEVLHGASYLSFFCCANSFLWAQARRLGWIQLRHHYQNCKPYQVSTDPPLRTSGHIDMIFPSTRICRGVLNGNPSCGTETSIDRNCT